MLQLKDENYYQISGWMLNKLKLKGTELNIYAIIYGFSQDGISECRCSLNYMCLFTGVSKPSVIKALNGLLNKNLITKRENTMNNVKENFYKANLDVVKNFNERSKETLPPSSKETLQEGSKETLPNNITIKEIINIYHNLCPSLPKCKTLSDKRKKQIKARLDTYSLDEVKEVFINAENSNFLKGEVNGFKADLDWLMNDNNFAKTLEGKYNKVFKGTEDKNFKGRQYDEKELNAMFNDIDKIML